MTGVIQKQNQQVKPFDNANIQLVSKSMENNLLIGRLNRTDNEDCHHTVQKFLFDIIHITKLDDGIYEACRIDVVRKGPSRHMLI